MNDLQQDIQKTIDWAYRIYQKWLPSHELNELLQVVFYVGESGISKDDTTLLRSVKILLSYAEDAKFALQLRDILHMLVLLICCYIHVYKWRVHNKEWNLCFNRCSIDIRDDWNKLIFKIGGNIIFGWFFKRILPK